MSAHDDMAQNGSTRRPILAYVRPGPHPYANTSLAQALAAEFTEYDVRVIDVVDRLRRRRDRLGRAAAAACGYYGIDILRSRRNAKDALLRTPTAASLLRRTTLDALAELPEQPAVTLQIQSLFDAHLPGVPHFVYTDHAHLTNLQYDDFDPARLYSSRWISAERSIYANATACLVRSTHVGASLSRDYAVPADKVALVYAGINAEGDRAETPQVENHQRANIVFVGIDWVRKGGPTLLQAFRQVRVNHPSATLTIVGCAPPEATGEGVEVLGRIPLAEVAGILSRASLFCLPTTVEPFGIAFLEAMSHGLPVVATAVGAVPDMVENGVSGLLVAPGDSEALAAALDRLLSDETFRVSAGRRGRELVSQRYNWANVTGRMRTAMGLERALV